MDNKINKKYTVKDFCKQYQNFSGDQLKENLVKSVMKPHYVSYEMKITICEMIIDNSYYKKDAEGNKTNKLHINSPAQFMLYHMNLINQYTSITIDFSNVLEEFNLLNESGLLDIIFSRIPEKEVKEFRMILDMVENDTLQNEYETHAFISNQVERFGELAGATLSPLLEIIGKNLENLDEKKLEKILNKVMK